MANKKRKCRYCKEYEIVEDGETINGTFFCNIDHATSYAYKNKDKGRKIKHRQEKKAFRDNDLKIRKEAAVRACHAYIRERDKNKGCVTCETSLVGIKFDAGHFLKATNSYTKFMEKNIHGQCVRCNQYMGGQELAYKEKIIEMYGYNTLKALEKCKSKRIKRTPGDYKKIEEHYKQKLKELVK